jgi:hypothetical protein
MLDKLAAASSSSAWQPVAVALRLQVQVHAFSYPLLSTAEQES